MKLSLVIDHLKASVDGLHNRVEGAISLATLGERSAVQDQKGFVLPLKETAQANRIAANAVRQRVTEQIGVVIAVRNVRDASGEAAHDGGLDLIRSQLLSAMLGWVPDIGYSQFEYSGGSLLMMKEGTVYWLYRFETARNETNI